MFYPSLVRFSLLLLQFSQHTFAGISHQMDDRSIKENIRRRREELGLTQDEVAGLLNIDRTTYRNLEMGSTRMLNSHLSLLSQALGTSVYGLLSGTFTTGTPDFATFDDVTTLYRRKISDNEEQYQQKCEALMKRIETLEKQNEMLSMWLEDSRDLCAMYKKLATEEKKN